MKKPHIAAKLEHAGSRPIRSSAARDASAPRGAELARNLPTEDDVEVREAPPLAAKTHPPGAIDDAKPALEDSEEGHHHHPTELGVVSFGSDPEAADAAADLAGDLSESWMAGATLGDEDASDRALDRAEAPVFEVEFEIEEELGGIDEVEGEGELPKRPPTAHHR